MATHLALQSRWWRALAVLHAMEQGSATGMVKPCSFRAALKRFGGIGFRFMSRPAFYLMMSKLEAEGLIAKRQLGETPDHGLAYVITVRGRENYVEQAAWIGNAAQKEAHP